MEKSTVKVFVSSTVYDLIDVRAEIRALLEELGVEAVMSDYTGSGFRQVPDRNSIETCIAHVRTCDYVIMVLSQRYGPPLNGVLSYLTEPLSPMHYEYRVAVESQKAVLFYARDRLIAECDIWRRSGRPDTTKKMKLNWTPKKGIGGWPNALSLFRLLDERSRLADKSVNWVSPFSDSMQLKRAIIEDIGARAKRLAFARQVTEGRCPEVVLRVEVAQIAESAVGLIHLENVSNYGACEVRVACSIANGIDRACVYIASHERWSVANISLAFEPFAGTLSVRFQDMAGNEIADAYSVSYMPSAGRAVGLQIERVAREYLVYDGDSKNVVVRSGDGSQDNT